MVMNPAVAAQLISGGTELLSNLLGTRASADVQRQAYEEQMRQEGLEREFREKELALEEKLRGREMTEAERINALREQAYSQTMGMAGEQMGAGEAEFAKSISQPVPELQKAREALEARGTRAMETGRGQIMAGLSQAGVRGGQAATHLRRGMGEMATGMQEDITEMELQEAMKRAAAGRAYQSEKAARAQTAGLRAPAY